MDRTVLQRVQSCLANPGRIDADDVSRMRREIFSDGIVGAPEAEALLTLNNQIADQSPEEPVFPGGPDRLSRTPGAPAGHISDENAVWLVDRISRDGKVESRNELELLVKVLETAQTTPGPLILCAAPGRGRRVDGRGGRWPRAGQLEKGVINAEEAGLMRRILHAMSSPGGIGISRDEAELLFMLNDKSAHEKNDPAWNDLFVRAIANYVLGYSRHALATREEARRQQTFLDSNTPGLSGMIAGMFSGGLSGIADALRDPGGLFDDGETAARARNEAFEAGARDAERVEATEARWLVDRIGKDGSMHDNERALLKFIGETASDIHDDLKPLLAKVA
jgi:hypothetical protein